MFHFATKGTIFLTVIISVNAKYGNVGAISKRWTKLVDEVERIAFLKLNWTGIICVLQQDASKIQQHWHNKK